MADKDKRKLLLKEWKAAEKLKARCKFPIPDSELSAFFQVLALRVSESGCRHDTRLAQKGIDELGLSDEQANAVLDWCAEHGGYCDCEIAGNTQQHWLENRESG